MAKRAAAHYVASAANDKLDVDAVLRVAKQILTSDARRLYRPDGSQIPIPDLDDDTAAAIASIEWGKNGVTKVTFWSKTEVLNLLARYFGLFEQDDRTTTQDRARGYEWRH